MRRSICRSASRVLANGRLAAMGLVSYGLIASGLVSCAGTDTQDVSRPTNVVDLDASAAKFAAEHALSRAEGLSKAEGQRGEGTGPVRSEQRSRGFDFDSTLPDAESLPVIGPSVDVAAARDPSLGKSTIDELVAELDERLLGRRDRRERLESDSADERREALEDLAASLVALSYRSHHPDESLVATQALDALRSSDAPEAIDAKLLTAALLGRNGETDRRDELVDDVYRAIHSLGGSESSDRGPLAQLTELSVPRDAVEMIVPAGVEKSLDSARATEELGVAPTGSERMRPERTHEADASGSPSDADLPAVEAGLPAAKAEGEATGLTIGASTGEANSKSKFRLEKVTFAKEIFGLGSFTARDDRPFLPGEEALIYGEIAGFECPPVDDRNDTGYRRHFTATLRLVDASGNAHDFGVIIDGEEFVKEPSERLNFWALCTFPSDGDHGEYKLSIDAFDHVSRAPANAELHAVVRDSN